MVVATFQASHFEALSAQQAPLPGEMVPERAVIKDLLLELDDALPPTPFPHSQILGMNLCRHWSSEHRTSLWFPHVFNGHRVDEIYLRYGKSESEIRSFRHLLESAIGEPPDLGGFPSHSHLAIGLAADAFFYQLVLGPRAWLDLRNFSDTLLGPAQRGHALFSALVSLDGHGYEIAWGDETKRIGEFREADALGRYLANSPRAGKDWFVLRKHVTPSDGMLTVSSRDIQTEIGRLFPVFDLIALRRPPA